MGGQGNEDETVETVMWLRLVEKFALPERPELFASANTNFGLFATEIRRGIKTNGVITVGCMGAGTVNNALKAAMVAQEYTSRDGDAGKLVVVPTLQTFESGQGERTRMVLG